MKTKNVTGKSASAGEHFGSARGQSTLEYLTNYGFALLIIVVAGVALWQTNVFNPASMFTTKYCGGFAQVHCDDFALDTVGNLQFVFENFADPVSDISLVDDQGRLIPGSTCENYQNFQNNANGGQKFRCTTPGASIITGAAFGVVVSNQQVRVRYKVDSSGIYHIDTGIIAGPTG